MMKMYEYKKLNFGFIILCSERAVKLLECTAKSIKNRYPTIPYICSTDKSATARDIKEMKDICPTFKGKETYSSLINTGIKNSTTDWSFFVFAGSTIRRNLDLRFFTFIESEKDILFPIADNKAQFVTGTLNGLFLNKNTFKEIGNIEEKGTLDQVKTIWAAKAINKGCVFKAIANTKIC